MLTIEDRFSFDLLGRAYFRFDDGANRIEVFLHGLTGRERVLLNGKEVSVSRSLRSTSRHCFRSEQTYDDYIVDREASWHSGRLTCSLTRRGSPVGSYLITNRYSDRFLSVTAVGAGVGVAILANQLEIRPIYAIAALAVAMGGLLLTGFKAEYRTGVSC